MLNLHNKNDEQHGVGDLTQITFCIFSRCRVMCLKVRHESARPLVAESATGKAQPSAFRT